MGCLREDGMHVGCKRGCDGMGWHCEWWMVNAMVDEIVFEHDIMCVDGMVDGMHVECKCG